MAALSPARSAAFKILLAVERGQSHSDDLLRGKSVDVLAPSDRNLATALVLGVLRWQIWLDRQLRFFLKRPNAKLDLEVLIALRIGAFQLFFMDRIPARAAIDESVELAKQAGHRFASGMVNAVLRRAADAASPFRLLDARALEQAHIQAFPAWMVDRWVDLYGQETAQAICRHGQDQPTHTVRIASPDVQTELMQAGIQLEAGELLTTVRTVISGDVAATAAFQEGRARLQDEGSQLIAEIAACAGLAFDKNIDRVVDTCAAPGGKTLILAERIPAARIVACESSPQRFAQLRDRLSAHANRVECRLADATALTEDSIFDLALADVPCSGTGTLGRNPEIRHRLRPEDLPRQVERQQAIFRAALRAVRPGGRIVYSTCSMEPEENEQVVAAVLAEVPSARQLPLGSTIEALLTAGILTHSAAQRLHGCLAPEGALRLLPGSFRSDGFFVALMERVG